MAGNIPMERIVTHRTDLAGVVGDLPRWSMQKDGLIKAIIAID
jgi:hypothetical protein